MCVNMIGQQLKKKKNSELFFEENYTVDKSSKKRQGDYLKFNKYSGDTLVKGHFEQDKQVGIWSYMGADNSPYITYDYDLKKLVYIKDKSLEKASVQIKTEGKFKMSDVDHPAIYLGFKNEIDRTMMAVIKPPPSVFEQAKAGMVMASFDINENGEVENFRVETSYDQNLNKSIEKSVDIIKKGWLPVEVNGVPVVSKMYMMCSFSFVTGTVKPTKSKLMERADLLVVNMTYYSR